jgi:hypothetical protein
MGYRIAIHENHALLFAITVRAFIPMYQERILTSGALKALAVASELWTRSPNSSPASVHFYCELGTFVGT